MIIDRTTLKAAIKAFLETQSDAEGNKDEYWVTPHGMAENVLIDFLDYTTPDPLVAQIEKLKTEAKQLEIKRVNSFWE